MSDEEGPRLQAAVEAGAGFVKTSTGFSTGGAAMATEKEIKKINTIKLAESGLSGCIKGINPSKSAESGPSAVNQRDKSL